MLGILQPNERLFAAVIHDHYEGVKSAIAVGANVDDISPSGHAPLHLAVWSNNAEIVKLLLDHNVDINQEDERGRTVLHIAATAGYSGIVQLLLAHGADVHAEDGNGYTPLHGVAVMVPSSKKADPEDKGGYVLFQPSLPGT